MNLAQDIPLFLGVAQQPLLFDEIGVWGALILTLTGTACHAFLPRLRMKVEEDAKDRRLTVDDACRRIRFYGVCASFMTVTGVVALVLVLVDIM